MARREHRGKHEPLVITIRTPGQKLTLGRADGAIIMRALRGSQWCAKCENAPGGVCDDQLDDLDLADTYGDLTARLADVLPVPEGEARP